MTINDLLSKGKQLVSVLSNPQQSSVAAAGLAGAFSAEVNNLRKQASVDLSQFGVTIPVPLQSAFAKVVAPFQQVLQGDPNNPIPDNPSGQVFGLSYLAAGAVGLVLLVGIIFMLGRRTR